MNPGEKPMEMTMNNEGLVRSTSGEPTSKAKVWTGRVMTGLPILFLVWDAAMKIANIPEVVAASERIGFHKATLPFIAVIELLSVVLLSLKRTRVFGAVLISAYLGGAVATHVRIGDPLFNILFPIGFAGLIWGGLYLRDERVRALSPFAS
jgi:hypothetical protein